MEQLKHSEESIIKLGERLVEELNSDESNNTLARWIAHYIAELISNIELAASKDSKEQLQKECCDLILKLWSKREDLPITKPLDNLKPFLEVVEILKGKKENLISPHWIEYNAMPRSTEWATFADIVKNNSEAIFSKVAEMTLHKDILLKDIEWMKENKEFLTQEEKSFLGIADVMSSLYNGSGVIDLNNFQISDDNQKRVEEMFEDLEKLIEEQKQALKKVRNGFLGNK